METEVELSTFAARVKWLRRLLGKSAETFAEETGVVIGTLRYIEQGRTLNPGMNVIEQICSTYDVSAKWLILNRGPVFDAEDQVQTEFSQIRQQLALTRQELDKSLAETADKETIIQMFLKNAKVNQPAKRQPVGKAERVSTSPARRPDFGLNYQFQATPRATRV